MKPLKYLVTLLLITMISNLNAQEKGDIKGIVIDKITKQPLPGTNVMVIGTKKGAATDIDGVFFIKNLEEDIYKIKINFIGYQSYIETEVRVIRNKTTYIEEIELIQSVISTEGVSVTVGTFQVDRRAPVSNYTYSREEIRRSPGAAGDIFRALGTLPGVSSSGGEFSAFSVRGGSPKENIILIDNIPFDKVSHFNGGSEEQDKQGGRFSIFAPNLIEEANFQAGGFSVKYGGKNAAFLDLKIKEGNNENMTLDGRLDVLGWELNYDGPSQFHRNTSIVISARHQDFTRILELIGQEEFGSPRFTDIIIKTTTNINPRNKISFLGIFAPEKFDRTTTDVFESDNFASIDLTDLDEGKTLIGLNWRILTGKSSFMKNSFYYRGNNRLVTIGRANPIINGTLPQSEKDIHKKYTVRQDYSEIEFGIKNDFTFAPNSQSTIIAGVEISHTNYDYKRTQFGLDTLYVFDQDDFRPDPSQKFIVSSPDFVNFEFDESKINLASYAEYSWTTREKISFNTGIRYEYNEFNKKNYFSPRLSAKYLLNERTILNFATGIYYQVYKLDVFNAGKANIILKNERAYHYVFGLVRYLRDDLKLTTESYYKHLDDLIVTNDRTSGIMSNTGDGWAAGIDLSLIKRFVGKFYGQISYSYAKSERDDNYGDGSYPSDFNQPHIFNILGGYEINKKWSMAAKWKYATGRPKDSYLVHENIFNDSNLYRFSKEIISNNTDRLPDFHSFNIRVDYRSQFKHFALVSFIDVVNIYNYLNVNEDRFLEITGGEDHRGLRILPTAGMKIEF